MKKAAPEELTGVEVLQLLGTDGSGLSRPGSSVVADADEVVRGFKVMISPLSAW